jgi:hypothetical protein
LTGLHVLVRLPSAPAVPVFQTELKIWFCFSPCLRASVVDVLLGVTHSYIAGNFRPPVLVPDPPVPESPSPPRDPPLPLLVTVVTRPSRI